MQVTKRIVKAEDETWKSWNWRSEGDRLLNGAYFTASGKPTAATYARASSLAAKSSALVATLTSDAGVLHCRKGVRCWLSSTQSIPCKLIYSIHLHIYTYIGSNKILLGAQQIKVYIGILTHPLNHFLICIMSKESWSLLLVRVRDFFLTDVWFLFEYSVL